MAKFHRTDLVIFSHSREGKTWSYSRINRVINICANNLQGIHLCFRGRDDISLHMLLEYSQMFCCHELIDSPLRYLTLLHSERPKLYRVLAVLSAVGLKCVY